MARATNLHRVVESAGLVPVRLIPFRLILISSTSISSDLVLSTMQIVEVNIG